MVSGENAAAITHRKPTIDDARIALAGTPRRVTRTSCGRRLAARGEDEQHARGRVHPRVQTAQHRRQHHGVHDVVGVGNAHLGERGDERRGGQGPCRSRAGSSPAGRSRRRRRSGSAGSPSWRPSPPPFPGPPIPRRRSSRSPRRPSRRSPSTMPTVIAPKPIGMNPPCVHRLEKSIDLFGHSPSTKQRADSDEDQDRRHLDAGEPELEFAVGLHREEVGRGHQHHEDQRATATAGRRSSTARSSRPRSPRSRRRSPRNTSTASRPRSRPSCPARRASSRRTIRSTGWPPPFRPASA